MSRYDTTWGEVKVPRQEWSVLARDLIGGVATGEMAGLVMLATMMVSHAVLFGTSVWFPLQVIGSFLFGDAALDGARTEAAVTGLILHLLGPSLFWGFVFGALVHVTGFRRGFGIFALGPLVGLAASVIDVKLILPAAMTEMYGQDIWAREILGLRSWLYHIVFGLTLTRFAWVYRTLFAQPPPSS